MSWRNAIGRWFRIESTARQSTPTTALLGLEVEEKPFVQLSAVLDEDSSESLVVEKARTTRFRHKSRVSQCVGLLAQVGHRDNEVAFVEHVVSRDFAVEVFELVAFEAAADGEISRRKQNVPGRLVANVLTGKREAMLHVHHRSERCFCPFTRHNPAPSGLL
jgi:hypothetical protein